MMRCTICGVKMGEGFVVGIGPGRARSSLVPHWAPGQPRVGLWSGVRVERASLIPVVTHRCPRCGRLEWVAREAPERS